MALPARIEWIRRRSDAESQPTFSIYSADEPESTDGLELSVVIPCLNEHETVGACVRKAMAAIKASEISGEVIVADNGSIDGSQDIARQEGARVVQISDRGYGSALKGGIEAARGRYIVMGDADDSYDFGESPRFVEKLREGFELVQGCRLPSGGGIVKPGAMPWLHRLLGNPGLTFLARTMFRVPFHDIYCGMRGFKKATYEELELRSSGMEFATEMIIKASLFEVRCDELPITLWPDGRVKGRSHLRTFRDGWRTLRLFLVYSPQWLFFYPGLALILAGILGYGISLPGLRVGGIAFDVHTLVVASMLLLLGFQSVCFAIVTAAYSISHGHLPDSKYVRRFLDSFTLERGIATAAISTVLGVGLIGMVATQWSAGGFGELDYVNSMRMVVPGATAVTMGASAIFCSFLCVVVRGGK